VAIQQELVQKWARENGVEIIHEFADRCKSGLTAEGRDEFNDMMDNWVKVRKDFDFVLCLDVSRWGRFQDIDLSASRTDSWRAWPPAPTAMWLTSTCSRRPGTTSSRTPRRSGQA